MNSFAAFKRIIITLILSATLMLVVACTTAGTDATGTPMPPTATPKPVSTAADFIASDPKPAGITVTLWTVEQFSPQIGLIDQTLKTFETNFPTASESVFVKKVSGQASTANYLLSAKNIAPEIVPDVAIVRDDQLPQIWRAGLVQPLDGIIDRTIVQDLLPAARELGTIDGQLVALPLQLNTEHLVANTTLITPTPVSWQEVLSASTTYRFAGIGLNGGLSDATLVQYLASGGTFTDDSGAPAISPQVLQSVLSYYAALQAQDSISADMVSVADPAEYWTDYKLGKIGLAHIDTHTFLADRHQLQTSVPAAIPTETGKPKTIVHGWVIVLLTNDPFRQQEAVNLMETFLSTETTAAWASYAQSIPPRQSAFTLVAGDDPYWKFLEGYLNAAVAVPTFTNYQDISRTLQQAVNSVLNGTDTIDDAVQRAKNDIGQ